MDQNNNVQASSQITFAEIIRMFRGKFKLVLLITLVVAIIGGALGAFFTLSAKNYEATIKFYLTTQDGSQALIPLLSSDSFAEKLLLEENGLPKKEECADKKAYDDALAAINKYNKAVEDKKDAVKDSILKTSEFTVAESEYNNALEEYNRRFEELSIYLSAQDKVASGETHAATIALYESRLEEARAVLSSVTLTYTQAKNAKAEALDAVVKAKEEVKETRYDAQEKAEVVLAPWREQENIKELICTITTSVTYQYAKHIDDPEAEQTLTDSAQNQNFAFLVINVNVADDEETAKFIVERLKSRIPAFVEDNIARVTDDPEPHCTLVSTFAEVEEANPQGLVKTVIKYSILPAIITFVVICCVIIAKGCMPADATDNKPKKNKENA